MFRTIVSCVVCVEFSVAFCSLNFLAIGGSPRFWVARGLTLFLPLRQRPFPGWFEWPDLSVTLAAYVFSPPTKPKYFYKLAFFLVLPGA